MAKMRWVAWTIVAAIAAGAVSNSIARGDEKSPEEVLSAKGLVRSGKYYLLPKVESAIQRLNLAENLEAERMRDAFEPPPMPDGPMGPRRGMGFGPGGTRNGPPEENERRLIEVLAKLDDRELIAAMIEGKTGVDRLPPNHRLAVCMFLCKKLVDQYDRVAADPQVTAALKELNKKRSPKFAVGPPQAYKSRMVSAAADTIRAKALKINKGTSTFSPRLDEEALKCVAEIDKLAAKLRQLERIVDDVKVKKGKQDEASRAVVEYAAQRRLYVERTRELRKKVAEARRLHETLLDDPELRDALDDLDKYLGSKQKYRIVAKKLDDCETRLGAIEKTIATEQVPLEPDRGMDWAEANLNDSSPPLKMLVDFDSPVVRLSARQAAAIGLALADAPTIETTSDDGRDFEAKRVVLKSLRVGGFVAKDVPCIVMPDSFGNSPPVLGGAFLNQFVADLDSSSGKLTLARVDLRPPSHAASPAAPDAKVGGK